MDETAAPAAPAAPRSIGERLRAGRERAGLSVAAAAEKLHLDIKVIEALEADRFAELGASVYVRGHLRRYADFVGEPGAEMVSSYTAREARPPPPDLTQVPQAERRADPRRLVTPLVGLSCAAVLLLAIWWVLAGSHGSSDARLNPRAADFQRPCRTGRFRAGAADGGVVPAGPVVQAPSAASVSRRRRYAAAATDRARSPSVTQTRKRRRQRRARHASRSISPMTAGSRSTTHAANRNCSSTWRARAACRP